MEDKPRYSRITDIVHLIMLMLSKYNGITLKDIQEEFNVSRRTAERMRDSILYALPQVEELEADSKIKHWGFTNYTMNELASLQANDIALLEKIKSNCDEVSAQDLDLVIEKIKVGNRKRLTTLENDIEFILHSEGCAIKQAPNYKINLNTVLTIREAIKNQIKISAKYNNKDKVLSPLGLIYGEKIHLIAREDAKGTKEYNYLLHKLENVKLTVERFDAKGFDIKEFAKKSFGVYQGEIFDVKLKFAPEVSEDVLNYEFHPTQKVKLQNDGSVEVSFKASGSKHIIWHLFKWGNSVEILSPKSLKQEYKEYLEEVLKGVLK